MGKKYISRINQLIQRLVTQLLLEQSTWAFHHLVEKKARSRLGMTVPEPDSIEVVTEP